MNILNKNRSKLDPYGTSEATEKSFKVRITKTNKIITKIS